MAQMREQNKTPGKKPKQNGNKQRIRCRIQNTGYQDAQGTCWVLQQHKKRPRQKIKVILSEQRKAYKEPTVEGMKLRIKSMIWNTRKEKVFNQNRREEKEFFKK